MLISDHTAQALNYLRATGLEVCLLINFGKPKVEIKRLLPSVYWKTPKLITHQIHPPISCLSVFICG